MSYSVIGIGLPRTGTTSLAAALELLGYSGEHSCELNNTRRLSRNKAASMYLVDNSIYTRLSELVEANFGAKFILTDRDEESWRNSIGRFEAEFSQNISNYRKECIDLFADLDIKDQLLKLNVIDGSSEQSWASLCGFLGVAVPGRSFPSIDQNKEVAI